MLRIVFAAIFTVIAVPGFSQTSKEESCGHQADIAAAIVKARLDGVKERDLPQELAKNATWPEKYTQVVIPVFAPYIYEQKRSDLRKSDLRKTTYDQCMSLN
jgi:Tfp pilus assembly protein FimT